MTTAPKRTSRKLTAAAMNETINHSSPARRFSVPLSNLLACGVGVWWFCPRTYHITSCQKKQLLETRNPECVNAQGFKRVSPMHTHGGFQSIPNDCGNNSANDLSYDRLHKPLLSGPKVFSPASKLTSLCRWSCSYPHPHDTTVSRESQRAACPPNINKSAWFPCAYFLYPISERSCKKCVKV